MVWADIGDSYKGEGPQISIDLSSQTPPSQRIRVWSPEILGLLTQHYQKSGEPIRLLMLTDHVVRIALQKRTSKAVISGILWAYDSPNEVSSNTGLQQSRRCT